MEVVVVYYHWVSSSVVSAESAPFPFGAKEAPEFSFAEGFVWWKCLVWSHHLRSAVGGDPAPCAV